MHVTWFLLFTRATLRKHGLRCRPVSVCQSVTLVDCIHTDEDIVKLLFWPGSAITLILWPPASVHNSKGFSCGVKYTDWGGKNWRFSTESAVYLGNGTREAHGCYVTLIGNHRWRIDPCRFRWPWVTFDPDFKVTTFVEIADLKTARFRDKVVIEH